MDLKEQVFKEICFEVKVNVKFRESKDGGIHLWRSAELKKNKVREKTRSIQRTQIPPRL